MNRGIYIIGISAAFLSLVIIHLLSIDSREVVNKDKESLNKEDIRLWALANKNLKAIPEQSFAADPLHEERYELGKMLYYEPRLSINGTQSCNTCHDLNTFGVDNLSTSPGAIEGRRGDRNSPTVLNAVLHDSQFWDGRAKTLEEQAKGPILNPVEMAISHEDILLERLAGIEEYVTRFANAFPEDANALSYDNLAIAIGTFESTLLTPSRYDEFMNKSFTALSEKEKRGFSIFIESGCQTCHDGPALGGIQYRRFGEINDFWTLNNKIGKDKGMIMLTDNPGDLYKFKVPSLRNIEKTYPYFHDGSIWDLETSIHIMAKSQLNLDMTDEEIEDLVAFLKTLTGEVPERARQIPELPGN
ncbi:cytochrome-c peroxidase [Anditalea andensis]|uniref:Cytochrome C peroxidase n=1 Tax=Anditalea andensis TaxID=1048983 RepID=A0A074KY67_9BACT|nr:cytochrome c peroxidase [Anditalea andensis]KEO73120.1 cytochrome C peroxidase [Anditalea andensis]